MNKFKKTLSLIAAAAISASALAGLAVTAGAEDTTIKTDQIKMTYINESTSKVTGQDENGKDIVEADTSVRDVPSGEISAGETSKAGYNSWSSGTIGFANTGWYCNWVTYLKIDASSVTGTITGATLTMEVSGTTDSKRTGTYGAARIDYTGWDASTLTYTIASTNNMLSGKGVGDTVTTTTKSATVFESKSITITDAFTGDEDKIVTIAIYETAGGGGYIKNPTVKIESVDASQVGYYQVNYVDENGDSIGKAASTGSCSTETGYTLTSDDKASYVTEDKTAKWIYDSEKNTSEQFAVASQDEANPTQINVYFKKASTYTASLVPKATINGELTQIASEPWTETVFDGEAVTVHYDAYIKYEGKYYGSTRNGSEPRYGIKFSKVTENTSQDVTYTEVETQPEYAADLEDMTSSTKVEYTYDKKTDVDRFSRGSRYLITKGYKMTDALSGGKYTVKVYGRNEKNGERDMNVYITDSEPASGDTAAGSCKWGKAETNDHTISDLIVAPGQKIALGASDIAYDYIVVTKTAEWVNILPAVTGEGENAYADLANAGIITEEADKAKVASPVYAEFTADKAYSKPVVTFTVNYADSVGSTTRSLAYDPSIAYGEREEAIAKGETVKFGAVFKGINLKNLNAVATAVLTNAE